MHEFKEGSCLVSETCFLCNHHCPDHPPQICLRYCHAGDEKYAVVGGDGKTMAMTATMVVTGITAIVVMMVMMGLTTLIPHDKNHGHEDDDEGARDNEDEGHNADDAADRMLV